MKMNLGELIQVVERISLNDPHAEVMYSFGYMFPTEIMSWRGDYCHLALNYTDKESPMKGNDFLKVLKSVVGKTLPGYKGGEFAMHENTPVWVANYGDAGYTAVRNVIYRNGYILIEAGYEDY